MEIKAIQTPIIKKDQNLLAVFQDALNERLKEEDIVCVTSKVVSMEQGRIVKLSEVEPSKEARQMKKLKYSKDFEAHPELAELVLRESDRLFGDGFVYLTLKNNVLIANAGIDLSNAPEGYAILWPEKPWNWASNFRKELKSRYEVVNIGVVITDSHLTPLRRGVTGFAMAYSGFEGIQSEIGKPDLFGKPLRITEKAVADSLATMAVLVMGESGEGTPFALIREAPVIFTDREISSMESLIDPRIDLYAGIYSESFKKMLDTT
jgi:coenzyme F420-0:L-glutamate ligase/coenzyme F420-1:gamma-L-glutamate ligase